VSEAEKLAFNKLLAAAKDLGILEEVKQERERQYDKWGTEFDDEYTALDWHEMIADYNGWARRMAAMGSQDKARRRYIQIAALAVAAIAAMDRKADAEGVSNEVTK